jgi:DNA-binding NtrC family response regulator
MQSRAPARKIYQGQSGMRTLLIVDDDELIRRSLTEGLGLAGYNVIAVPTTTDALQELESSQPIHMAVIDIKMPPGHPHGFALGRMARLRRSDLPLVFMSGDPMVAEAEEPPEGCRVLIKPVRLQELLEIVEAEFGALPQPVHGALQTGR